jgi:hypothetical protein
MLHARAPSLVLNRAVATQTHRLGDGALWQRLVVGPLPSGQRWYLQVSFHGVDRASLYHQDSTGQWVGQHAGDHVSVAQWPLRDRLPAFAMQQGNGAHEYWLRIANKPIPVGAQLLLLNEDAFTDWRNTSYLLLGAYFGLALLVIYLSALAARQYADRAFAAYCAYAASMMMIQVCFMGVGGLFLWPQSPWWNNAAPYIFTMLSCTTATLLVREVCAVPRLSAPLDRFMLGWAAFGVVGGAGYVAWPGATVFLVISLYQVGTMVLVLAISAWSHRQGERWALGLGLCFLPVVLTAPFPALRNLGLLNASFLTQYSLAIGAALEIPLQLWLLGRRARENSDANVRAHAMDTSDPLTGLPATARAALSPARRLAPRAAQPPALRRTGDRPVQLPRHCFAVRSRRGRPRPGAGGRTHSWRDARCRHRVAHRHAPLCRADGRPGAARTSGGPGHAGRGPRPEPFPPAARRRGAEAAHCHRAGARFSAARQF